MIRAAILIAIASPAYAESLCAPHDVILEQLVDRYGEARQAVMLDGLGRMVEVWANPASGTWTMTITAPGDLTCFVGVGTEYQDRKPNL